MKRVRCASGHFCERHFYYQNKQGFVQWTCKPCGWWMNE